MKVVVTEVFSEDLIEAQSTVRFGGFTDEGDYVLFTTERWYGSALAETLHVATWDVEIDIEDCQVLKHYVTEKNNG